MEEWVLQPLLSLRDSCTTVRCTPEGLTQNLKEQLIWKKKVVNTLRTADANIKLLHTWATLREVL